MLYICSRTGNSCGVMNENTIQSTLYITGKQCHWLPLAVNGLIIHVTFTVRFENKNFSARTKHRHGKVVLSEWNLAGYGRNVIASTTQVGLILRKDVKYISVPNMVNMSVAVWKRGFQRHSCLGYPQRLGQKI